MSTAWLVLEIILGVLGSILVWIVIGSTVASLYQRHRTRSTHHSTRPPASS